MGQKEAVKMRKKRGSKEGRKRGKVNENYSYSVSIVYVSYFHRKFKIIPFVLVLFF